MGFKSKHKTRVLVSTLSLLMVVSAVVPLFGTRVSAVTRLEKPCVLRRRRPDMNEELFSAVENSDVMTIMRLIRAGADVNAQNDDGDTPLHLAAQMGRLPVLRLFLGYRPHINAQNEEGKTPLYCAVEEGNTSVVEELIRNYADVNIPDDLGYTPLHIASSRGYCAIVQILLNHGAFKNAHADDGDTPLTMAVRDADQVTVNCLLDHVGIEFNDKGAGGNTPLHEAILRGNIQIVNDLIYRGAALDAKNDSNNTPLMFTTFDGGDIEIARILLDNGASCDTACEHGSTPLHMAVEQGQSDIVELLLSANASLNVQDDKGCTPRQLARDPYIMSLLDYYYTHGHMGRVCN